MKKVLICLFLITLFAPGLTQAGAVDCTTTHSTEEVTVTDFNTCTGEEVLLTFRRHHTFKICMSDGEVTIRMHSLVHGTGIGLTTGNRYVVNVNQREVIVPGMGCEESLDEMTRIALISQGPLPNLVIRATTSFTTNQNCEVITIDSDFKIECRG
jgi:hypothetical protein